MSSANAAELSFVRAAINCAGAIKGRARIDAVDSSRTNLVLQSCEVRIHDATPLLRILDLDREGFVCVTSPSKVLAPLSLQEIVVRQEELEVEYHREMSDLVRSLTGADVVLPYRAGLTVRMAMAHANNAGIPSEDTPVSTKTGMPLVFEPAHMAHADYSAASFHQLANMLHRHEKVPITPYRRAALYQLWRPLTLPPEDMPLALSDGRTSGARGGVLMDAVSGDEAIEGNSFETRIAPVDPAVCWYYFPRITPEEVIVFKGFDTAMEEQTVYHTAFSDPEAGANAIARRSIEVRTFAFWL